MKGTTQFAILGLLTVEPMSGYDLRKHFQESLIYFWNESYGQIYPTLKELARKGLVAPVSSEKAGERERQVYSLTAKGRKYLGAWLVRPPKKQAIRSEFLLKLFLGRSVPPRALSEQIRRFQIEQEQLLAMFLIIRDEVRVEHAKSPDLKYWMLTVDHGIRMRRADIEWSKKALLVLDSPAENRNAQPPRARRQFRDRPSIRAR